MSKQPPANQSPPSASHWSKKMRKEMESAIESASNGLHDSTSWWDSYYAEIYGKPLIEKLLDDLDRIAARYANDLTR